MNLLQNSQKVVPETSTSINTYEMADSRFQLYNLENRIGIVPADFKFPQCSVAIAYQLWCCGDERKGYPPFRMLTSKDMSNRTLSARLSEFQYIMKTIDRLTGFVDLRSRDLRLNEVIHCFNEQMQ